MDIKKIGRQFIFCLLLLAVSGSLASCGAVQGGENTPVAGITYEVDPSFREFYKSLGSEDMLGPAISESFPFQSLKCQYTVNVLICLDPSRTGENRFGLYPLGNTLNIKETPPEETNTSDGRVVNGYIIYEEFIPAYDRYSGEHFAGAPLTQVHINYSQERYEQYFENMGFYRAFSDSPGSVKLLAYGAQACAADCGYSPPKVALVSSTTSSSISEPFLPQLGKIGAATIFGEPLTQPYITEDGTREQIYTNAALYNPTGKENEVLLRKLPVILQLYHSDPVTKQYGNEDGVVFYAVKGELGYHVPLMFDKFISEHGGLKISGDPISEIIEVEPGVYRQCMENYCLEYRPDLPAENQVSLTALGSLYLEKMQQQENQEKPLVISAETVNITLVEQYKQIPSTSPQHIEIAVTTKNDGKPLEGIESSLKLTLPDGSVHAQDIPATRTDGTTSVIIPALSRILNGTILSYSVCLKTASSQPVCAFSSYLVWNSP